MAHQGLVPEFASLSPSFGEAMKIWLKRFLSAANANASSQLPPSAGPLYSLRFGLKVGSLN